MSGPTTRPTMPRSGLADQPTDAQTAYQNELARNGQAAADRLRTRLAFLNGVNSGTPEATNAQKLAYALSHSK